MAVINIVPRPSPGIQANRITADYIHSALVKNGSQQTIPAGSVVYVQSSGCGCHCEVYPAIANSNEKSGAVGIAPSAIFVGKHSRIAVSGSVSFILEEGADVPNNGDLLYLSATQAGAVTTQIPNFQENTIVVVGKVVTGKVILDVVQTAVSGGAAAGGAPAVELPGGDV
jgi:hypothetical protein